MFSLTAIRKLSSFLDNEQNDLITTLPPACHPRLFDLSIYSDLVECSVQTKPMTFHSNLAASFRG